MGEDEVEIVVKVCSDGRSVAIAEDVGGDTRKDNDGDEYHDGENAKDAGVGVVREEIVPFFDDIFQPVGDEDRQRQDDEDDNAGIEPSHDGGEKEEYKSDSVPRGADALNGREEAEESDK